MVLFITPHILLDLFLASGPRYPNQRENGEARIKV